ncbi:helix-turn-helix domain-containing protein [Maliponia aquimaris]|uniref:Helix-turn-helix protein n=1 Tax=Maliponia aquimaris TaxID=1673631 RepID=A0A238KCA5_9RHOB|nr:helix-turn-helix transcriptional regulator [Maliponia aquimaris]SMX40471.1 helix-turn-helix protein [Maliponia aquimaris]
MLHGEDFSRVPIERVSEELGRRINLWRLSRQIKMADMAEEMGVSRPTLQRLLEGGNTSTETLLRALRALGLIGNLDVLVPDISSSPIARLEGGPPLSERKRVASRQEPKSGEAWVWGDEEDSE